MKKIFKNKTLFGFILFFCLFLFSNIDVYAAIDMTDWEIQVEKDIINDYKIKADETNVAFMKDKDSVIGDIVEHIYIESSSTSGFESSPLEDSEFDIYKTGLYEGWGDLLYRYSKATGYVNGTAEILGSDSAQQGYGYNFFLDDTSASINFMHYNEWTDSQKEYYSTILPNLGETLKREFSTKCIYYLTPYYTSDANYHYFYCTLLDCNNNYISEISVQASKTNFNVSNTGTTYRSKIAQMVEDNKLTIIQHAMPNFDLDTSCAKSTFILNNLNLYFKPVTENIRITNELYNNQLGSLQRNLQILTTTTTNIDNMINAGGTSSGSWTFAAFYDISYMNASDDMATHMSLAEANDTYVQARKDCLSYLIKIYNEAYSESFITMINETSKSMETHMKHKRYRTDEEYAIAAAEQGKETQRVVYYEGAKFILSNDNSNRFIRTYGSSGFYFKNRCLNLSTYGIYDNDLLSNDMKLDPNNMEHLTAIYKLFLSVDNPEGIKDDREHYVNLITRAKPFEVGAKPLWVQPQPFDIVFDDTTVSYMEFLTTSCIINNPLDRYEFWGQNMSNEKDTTYYGEAVELLPDNPDDDNTKNKDGYIGEPNHIVKINPNNNWGIYLFTRYKYVNYVYKIYYGFYGEHPELTIKKLNRSSSSMFYEKIEEDITYTKKDDNMYGWFWKTTYSIKEKSGGNYVTQNMVSQQESLIRDRIMQNVEINNDIKWLTVWDMRYPNALNNYSSFDAKNNQKYGKGDLYCYKNAVRAETIYYQVNVPFSVDVDGGRNAKDYILSLGADKNNTFECSETITLCECDDEVGGCSLDTNELAMSATVTN